MVDDVLFVLFLQMLFIGVLTNERMQIDIHMLKHQVNIFVVTCPQNILQNYDVWMLQLLQKHDLSVSSLSICGVSESIEVLFESFDFVGLFVDDFPNYAVGTAADLLDKLILFQNVRFYFFCHNKITVI